ncbi:MAG: glycosyltransferase [Pseudomonadota bacterium]
MSDSKGQPAQPSRSTIVITPRERFGVAELSLQTLRSLTSGAYDVIYVDGGSPKPVAKQLQSICVEAGYQYLRYDHYLSPNEARNIGQRAAKTDYVVFLDNDVIVSEGWLTALEVCADETGADVVAPLTCQRAPFHQEIHQAGGEFAADKDSFFNGDAAARRITDVHLLQGQKTAEVALSRGETQCCEFHCALVRASAFERYGDLDENLLATKEHIDFCMTIWQRGGKVMFEPTSVVTYVFPGRAYPITVRDWSFFALRWSPRWQKASLNAFQAKWDLHEDPYFKRRAGMLDWRLKEGIVKPLARKLPVIGKSFRGLTLITYLLMPLARAWSDWLVANDARRRRAL